MAQLNQLNQKTESKKFFHFSITQAPFNPEPLFCSHTVRAYCSNHLPAGVLNIERFLGVHSVCCTAHAAILLPFATLLQSAERKMMAILWLQTSVWVAKSYDSKSWGSKSFESSKFFRNWEQLFFVVNPLHPLASTWINLQTFRSNFVTNKLREQRDSLWDSL